MLDLAGGDVQWPDGVSGELPAKKTDEQLLNHYERHTRFCPACQKVMACLFGLCITL